MNFYLMDHIKIEPGEDGISVVTAKVPSYMVGEILSLITNMEHIARVLRTKTRSMEAISKARELKIIP